MEPTAKAIYLATMMHQPPSIQALATKLGMDRRPVADQCKELVRLGWMQVGVEGAKRPPAAVLPREVEVRLAAETHKLIKLAPYGGEEDTWRFIDWIVAPGVRLVRNARPSFLDNPKTGHKLEYDVFAPDYAWGNEYHGDQHFSPTTQFPGEKEFIERFKRDLLKIHLSKKNNVRLSVITKNDLSLDRVLAAIPADVPRRPFDPKGPYVQMLEKIGREIAGTQDWDRE